MLRSRRIPRKTLRPGVALLLALGLLAGLSFPGAVKAQEPGAGLQRWVINPAESEVIYRVEETFLAQVTRAVAVGVTRTIEGEVQMDPADPSSIQVSPVRVNIRDFTSDQPRRDQRIRREWLESDRYPIAEFVVTSIEGLPAEIREGEVTPVTVHGNLTVRETTRPVSWEGTLSLADGALKGSFETEILMTDFGFDPPSILGVLRAENEVKLEFNFVAEPAQ